MTEKVWTPIGIVPKYYGAHSLGWVETVWVIERSNDGDLRRYLLSFDDIPDVSEEIL